MRARPLTLSNLYCIPGAEVLMTRNRVVKALLMAVAVTACSETGDPTAATPQNGLFNVAGAALQTFSPRASDATATRTIGPAGGTLDAGGVSLSIPAGALREDTEITMTVPAGRFLEVDFAPHGLQFDRPATLSFSLAGSAAALNARSAGGLAGAYFDGDLATGSFRTLETLNVRVRGTVLSYEIEHFSGYCVVSGMNSQCDCDF